MHSSLQVQGNVSLKNYGCRRSRARSTLTCVWVKLRSRRRIAKGSSKKKQNPGRQPSQQTDGDEERLTTLEPRVCTCAFHPSLLTPLRLSGCECHEGSAWPQELPRDSSALLLPARGVRDRGGERLGKQGAGGMSRASPRTQRPRCPDPLTSLGGALPRIPNTQVFGTYAWLACPAKSHWVLDVPGAPQSLN